MKLMIITTYPLTSTSKATEVFLEMLSKDPIPDNIEMLGMYTSFGGDGIMTYSIFDIKEKADEGLREISKRLTNFYSVEGYKVESHVIYPIEESLAIIGKEMPAA